MSGPFSLHRGWIGLVLVLVVWRRKCFARRDGFHVLSLFVGRKAKYSFLGNRKRSFEEAVAPLRGYSSHGTTRQHFARKENPSYVYVS